MHKVTINGEEKYTAHKTLLSDFLISQGLSVEHPCGGKGICQKCVVTVNRRKELSCKYLIESDIIVELPEKNSIFSETGANESGELTDNLCFALDIGTTTLALALVSLDENKIIKVITANNPQRSFGADIMTRIEYCSYNGVEALTSSLVSEINSMIAKMDVGNITKLYASGNATMLHLFLGVDCSSLGVAPFTPVFLEKKVIDANKIGIIGVEAVECLPSVATFVGADIVAGLNFVDRPEKGKHSLLIDLGTNAEIVLFSDESAVCTSAAAGPCFEGANITCGMSATEGAIYSYSKNKVETIGGFPAKGVCGTGLVDIIAELIKDSVVDETGYMECESFEVANGISITQADIREYQLAKSAVYSGILTLLETKKVSYDEIDKMYISGGFSAKINVDNAVKTGLLPKELGSKCISVNNSSLLGTVKYACEKNDLEVFINNSTYIDLSANSTFAELFINNMMFEV